MKIRKAFYGILCLFVPLVGMTVSTAPKTLEKNEFPYYHGQRAKLFDYRYNENDILNEPKLKEQYKYNFQYMGIGMPGYESYSVWNDYRGEKTNGEKVTVAVIDSGIDIFHEDFLKPEANGVDLNFKNIENYSTLDKRSCYIHDIGALASGDYYYPNVVTEKGIVKAYDEEVYDSEHKEYYSHGTQTAACIGAAINGMSGLGVAPNVNILMIRCDLLLSSVDVALRYAADCGASVINMSFGIYDTKDTDDDGLQQEDSWADSALELQAGIDYALKKDCVLVAAAGNENTNQKSYPACNKGVVGVGALEKHSGSILSDYSNYNSKNDTPNTDNSVDVVAPGTIFCPTVPSKPIRGNSDSSVADNDFLEANGTSFASPLTAGAIALYRAANPSKTGPEAVQALKDSCIDIGEKNWDAQFGYGRVDLYHYLDNGEKAIEVKIDPEIVELKRTNENPVPECQLETTFLPLNASPLSKKGIWISLDESIATVDSYSGLVRGHKAGTTQIGYLTELDGLEGYATIKVTGEPTIQPTMQTVKLNSDSFNAYDNYSWKTTKPELPFETNAYFYSSGKNMQFNSRKESHYIFNSQKVPGTLKEISLTGAGTKDRNWQIKTLDKSFGYVLKNPTEGTDQGIKLIDNTKTTFPLNTQDKYFAIAYQGEGSGSLAEIEIKYLGYFIPILYLNYNSITLQGNAVRQLVASSNGKVTWSVENPSIASVSQTGLVKGLSKGTTTVIAKNGPIERRCEVTVTNSPAKLTSIKIKTKLPETIKFMSSDVPTNVLATATYGANENTKEVQATLSPIDTSKLGPQEVIATYTESGITKTDTTIIYITNVGASNDPTVVPSNSNLTTVSKNNTFSQSNKVITGENGSTWNLSMEGKSVNSIYISYNGSYDGAQIGSGKGEKPTLITLSSSSFTDKVITNVDVQFASENAKLKVQVGNNNFKSVSNNTNEVTTSGVVEKYSFKGNAQGEVKILVSNITKNSYIRSIKVTFETQESKEWTGDDQAKAYIAYLKTFKTCASDWQNRNEIKRLVNEYNAMLQESKDSELFNKEFSDNGNIKTSPINKLKYIVSQYNATIQDGEEKLVLVLKTDVNGKPTIQYLGEPSVQINNDNAIVIASLVTLLISASLLFTILAIKAKRRRNE